MQKIAPLYQSSSLQLYPIRLLGLGSQNEIILVEDQHHVKSILKRILPLHLKEREVQSSLKSLLIQEMYHLSLISYSHIPKSLNLLDNGRTLSLHLQWVKGSSLRMHIRKHQKQGTWFSPQTVNQWLNELTETLIYIHTSVFDEWRNHLQLVHGDLSPHNLIIDESDQSLKLIDWSSSSSQYTPSHLKKWCKGKAHYLSPLRRQRQHQNHHDLSATPACDWYALGVISFELIVGCPPSMAFLNQSKTQQSQILKHQGWPDIWIYWVIELLSKDPQRRLNLIYNEAWHTQFISMNFDF